MEGAALIAAPGGFALPPLHEIQHNSVYIIYCLKDIYTCWYNTTHYAFCD